jgi:hypothetical protein
MSEKVLHEVRFIETDDGFRVEIKGDKEKIREMGFGPGLGMMMGLGHRMRHKHHRRHGRHRQGHHGAHKHGRKGWGWWWDDAEDVEADFEPKEKSPEEI